MGTEFEIVIAAKDLHVAFELEQYARHLEQLWTRFDKSSELMKLNMNSGASLVVSNETAQLVSEMRRGFIITDGWFNAGVLNHMNEHGFSANVIFDNPRKIESERYFQLWNEVLIDEQFVCLPPGLAIDAGGIGKGLAADFIADKAMNLGCEGVVVNAGGEVAVRGETNNPQGWTVGVENPFNEGQHVATVRLSAGGLATSAPSGWIVDGKSHIMNPHTGMPISHELAQATVLCARAVDAEVLAKMCLLMPVEESLVKIDKLGAAALIIRDDMTMFASAKWSDYQ